ncbi:RNA polymerase sigma factor [Flavisolibacter ginsenosidimutans]|uniref:Sigma-70 family RNA polymerase sigma factor n=1 Tax=Flavisolibacter ginsenosidimutans TaxID=661481 RepID=A0A5B8UH23_9BACT|nr:sigma-70 family RNA polymerase sigma factor [Flavisolibacter ginsenosidimutans]QEC55961.1 sigma-70 family RNA polymerase sigma factor [Flavisolibacter ginsenosidimutans]
MAFLRNISSNGFSDAELIERYRYTNDLAVLGGLYNRYMDLVYGVCLKYLKTPEDAQDSVMNIFEELIAKLQKHEVGNFKSWLYTLAKNHCLMRLRSEKRTPVVTMKEEFVQSEEAVHLEDVIIKEESYLQMEDCLKQLSNEQRRTIELFYLQGKCYNEIAVETGLEWKAVRSYIQNGRRNLKLCMESNTKATVVK